MNSFSREMRSNLWPRREFEMYILSPQCNQATLHFPARTNWCGTTDVGLRNRKKITIDTVWRGCGAKRCWTAHLKHVFSQQTNDRVPTNENRCEQIGEMTLTKTLKMGNSPLSLIDRPGWLLLTYRMSVRCSTIDELNSSPRRPFMCCRTCKPNFSFW